MKLCFSRIALLRKAAAQSHPFPASCCPADCDCAIARRRGVAQREPKPLVTPPDYLGGSTQRDSKSRRRVQSASLSRVLKVNTLPRVSRRRFLMSWRRTPNPRPEMHAMTSNLEGSEAPSRWLSSTRCRMRATLSRAVPSTGMNSEAPAAAYEGGGSSLPFTALLHLRVAF